LHDEIDRNMAMLGINSVGEMSRNQLMSAYGIEGFQY
jgi:isopentenyl diphosphate isomerase/L-lactate dehydrogenase-like FMN-dependent dehydrogenase